MNRDKLTKILAAFTALMVVAYLGVNIYRTAGNRLKTQTAYINTVSDTVDADMFIIREEKIIDGKDSGVVVPLAVNGERVGKGSEIAAVFSSEKAAENYSSSISLQKKLDTYEKINNQVKLANLDLDKLSTEVNTDFYSMLDAVYNSDFSNISDDILSFSEKLSRKNVSLGYDVDCSSQIEAIQSEISSLSVETPKEVIEAESAGYYVSRPDGYEDILTVDDVDTLTEEQLTAALAADKAEDVNSFGKIITGYEWYIATEIGAESLSGIEKGKTMRLVLGDGENDTIKATLYSKQNLEDNKVLVVFKTSNMNEDLATLRKVNGKIIIRNYTGIKIRKEAVRFDENGNEGVYILEGNSKKFNRINEIYSDDNYVIAEVVQGTAGWLSQYDEVIISGKDVDDGKIVA